MRLFIFVCLFSLFLLLLRVMISVCIGLVIVVWILGGDGSLAWAESDDFAWFFPALRAGGPEPNATKLGLEVDLHARHHRR